jgi:hypothetical protein
VSIFENVVLLVASAILLLGCTQGRVGNKAIGFALPNVRGGQFLYQPQAHRSLLMAFLQTQPDSSNSNASRRTVPMLMSMDHQYRTSGLDVVVIDATKLASPGNTKGAMPAQAVSMDTLLNTSYDWTLSVPLLVDSDGKVARLYEVKQVPTMILVDATGRIAERWTGTQYPGTLAGKIQDLVGGPIANRQPNDKAPHEH